MCNWIKNLWGQLFSLIKRKRKIRVVNQRFNERRESRKKKYYIVPFYPGMIQKENMVNYGEVLGSRLSSSFVLQMVSRMRHGTICSM